VQKSVVETLYFALSENLEEWRAKMMELKTKEDAVNGSQPSNSKPKGDRPAEEEPEQGKNGGRNRFRKFLRLIPQDPAAPGLVILPGYGDIIPGGAGVVETTTLAIEGVRKSLQKKLAQREMSKAKKRAALDEGAATKASRLRSTGGENAVTKPLSSLKPPMHSASFDATRYKSAPKSAAIARLVCSLSYSNSGFFRLFLKRPFNSKLVSVKQIMCLGKIFSTTYYVF
jgi:hypothetical protein